MTEKTSTAPVMSLLDKLKRMYVDPPAQGTCYLHITPEDQRLMIDLLTSTTPDVVGVDVKKALRFAAHVIELYDDATMRDDYMISGTEASEVVLALADSPYAAPRVQGDASEVNARAMELLRTYKTWIGGHRPDRDEDAEEAELWDETESVIAALAAQPKGDVSHPAEQTRGDGLDEPPLAGWWRHGNGHLSCGSFRVARADWEHEVCAAGSMRNEVFDWMCARLNAKSAPRQAVPDGWQLVPIEPTEEMIRNAWGSDTSTSDGNVKRVYAAMLAAAPSAGRMGVDRG